MLGLHARTPCQDSVLGLPCQAVLGLPCQDMPRLHRLGGRGAWVARRLGREHDSHGILA